jgi:lipoyl(octanoyl) transferase
LNSSLNSLTQFIDLGLVDYQQAWDYQTNLFNQILEVKKQNRDLAFDQQLLTNNYLIFCEHPHVYTLGKSGNENNLLIKKENLHSINASYYPINRGGDITYHGPGQLVAYPILDLENFFTDIHKYMRLLEEAVIQTLHEFTIDAGRVVGLTGVWLNHENKINPRKICALGVKTSRWVTLHGLALNVNTDLSYFNHIVPCGINDKAVTSMEKELGTKVDIELVKPILKEKIASLFEMSLIN